MKKIFFTPGPSQLYPSLRKHLDGAFDANIGSLSHRSTQFQELFSETTANLRQLLRIPQSHHIFFLASGTEAMERVIENLVDKESFHFVNGSFSKRFYATAQELRRKPIKIEAALGKGFDFFEEKIPASSELLCFTHNETSTGVMLSIEEIHRLKKMYPKKLVAVDIVSSAPYPALDFSLIDCAFFSVQKLFGLPAGLAVIILSPAALGTSLKLQQKGVHIGSYHSFPSLAKYAEKNQTPETPPVLHIFLLNKIIQHMLESRLSVIRKNIEKQAELLYTFFDLHKKWKPFVVDKKYRSVTVITVETGEDTVALKKFLETRGIIVGGGYGVLKESQIRIANFPAVNMNEVNLLLKHLKSY